MKFELYNKTNKTKVIPNYNYRGSSSMKPFQTKDIEEYMIKFFRPYEKIGVVIRSKRDSGETPIHDEFVNPQVEIVKPILEINNKEIPNDEKPEMPDEVPLEESTAGETIVYDIVEEEIDGKKQNVYYERDRLMELPFKELRKIVKEKNLTIEGKASKKESLVNAILKSHESK